jgi:hypothetical protein
MRFNMNFISVKISPAIYRVRELKNRTRAMSDAMGAGGVCGEAVALVVVDCYKESLLKGALLQC